MNTQVKFEIIESIGVISNGTKGWRKELNLVSWNGRPAKYDIRDWDESHEHMGKGLTLDAAELAELASLIAGIGNSAEPALEPEPDAEPVPAPTVKAEPKAKAKSEPKAQPAPASFDFAHVNEARINWMNLQIDEGDYQGYKFMGCTSTPDYTEIVLKNPLGPIEKHRVFGDPATGFTETKVV